MDYIYKAQSEFETSIERAKPESAQEPQLSVNCALWLIAPVIQSFGFMGRVVEFESAFWCLLAYFFRSVGPTELSRTVFLAAPSCTARHLPAKLREHWLSPADKRHGVTFTNISTRELEERESCKRKVSLLLRYGMWAWFRPSAATTSPKAERDLLMF